MTGKIESSQRAAWRMALLLCVRRERSARDEKPCQRRQLPSSVTVVMLYWRNIAGNTIAETDGTGSTTNASYNEYVFFDGRLIAQANPSSGNQYYYIVDHLGSTRADSGGKSFEFPQPMARFAFPRIIIHMGRS